MKLNNIIYYLFLFYINRKLSATPQLAFHLSHDFASSEVTESLSLDQTVRSESGPIQSKVEVSKQTVRSESKLEFMLPHVMENPEIEHCSNYPFLKLQRISDTLDCSDGNLYIYCLTFEFGLNKPIWIRRPVMHEQNESEQNISYLVFYLVFLLFSLFEMSH